MYLVGVFFFVWDCWLIGLRFVFDAWGKGFSSVRAQARWDYSLEMTGHPSARGESLLMLTVHGASSFVATLHQTFQAERGNVIVW